MPTVFCLHFLGGSAREYIEMTASLAGAVRVVAIDLPGFGNAARTPGYAVADMADTVARAIGREAPQQWVLVGHSMGAKVAAVLARQAQDGARQLDGLAGLVLLAGSPPAPEPMETQQRNAMLGWFKGDGRSNLAEARRYIEDNVGTPLTAAMADRSVEDVLRANRAAWVAWLESGSREDWSERVGVLRLPTLIVAGAVDGSLGPNAQRRSMSPHFANARVEILAGAGHLLPLECPDAVGRLITEHVSSLR